MSVASAIYENVTGALSLVFAIVVLSRVLLWLRAHAHRPAAATGDTELAGLLDTLVTHRTHRLAAIVAEDGRPLRTAFVDASPDDRFEIGSLSKVVTGLVIADGIDRGELSLDTRLDALVDDVAPTLADITVAQLVTHTSGLPRLPSTTAMTLRVLAHGLFLTNPYARITAQRVLTDAARSRRGRVGESSYSNLGASVAGISVAAAQGVSYAELVQDRLFTPIGMVDTSALSHGTRAPRGWHGGRRAARWSMDGYAPAGGVVSTPADIARLAQALVDRSAPGIDTSVEPVGRGRGIFWILDSHGGAWHNGETGGYSGFLTLEVAPVRRVIVVLADSVPAEEQQRIAEKIGDALSVR
ncbi:serine hydrolase domain-containing protein [Williamsia maris]|uniref:CubicO group peptidase, beta-lactamase class C family n=1 Tax=Williamsia maris TaxID=72806 RepID=A0ABT1HDW3_9NOCA|nr:serine hydrolase domain-containing protein [Williamsia maris]MCP2175895.1 CubicO group peptidase, beta-lactamase class C family [Williamsia maris]